MVKMDSKARAKAVETRKQNLPQMSNPEERETVIVVDYHTGKIDVYSNNITVINRMTRKGYEHIEEQLLDKEVYSRRYEIDFEDMSKVITSGLFK